MAEHARGTELHPGPAVPTNMVLLTVSGEIPRTISTEIEQQLRPRADYLELAKSLKADLLDYSRAREICGLAGRGIERFGGPNLMLAYACWLLRSRYRTIVTDGEQVGLPFASLLKFASRRRPHHVMITHVISAPKKVVLMDYLKLASRIDRFVVYCRWQQEFIQSRWKVEQSRVDLVPFMVDERFFDPAKVKGERSHRPRICSVGLERRDYPTLIRAVEDLDVDVIIAAASPWSKQKDNTSGRRIPTNVTVRKFSQFELRQLYADCEFMVMPLQPVDFQAGITAILEAMAMGKAVICSRAPGQTDVIVEGENGRYVLVGDPSALRTEITRLLAQPEESARLGANARNLVVRELSLDHYAERLSRIVQDTLVQAPA
jgi:glycosyltransferase involved in cell wall biosynthesis